MSSFMTLTHLSGHMSFVVFFFSPIGVYSNYFDDKIKGGRKLPVRVVMTSQIPETSACAKYIEYVFNNRILID